MISPAKIFPMLIIAESLTAGCIYFALQDYKNGAYWTLAALLGVTVVWM